MKGQKSCPHEFTEKVKHLTGRGYYLRCRRCKKVKKMNGLYTPQDYPGGRTPKKWATT
jgi:hypothetical protein